MRSLILLLSLVTFRLIAAPSGLGGTPLSPVPGTSSSTVVNSNAFVSTNSISKFRVFSDGRVYGPSGLINTAGTTTSGIQEAINAAPQNSNTNLPSGISIQLAGGVYYLTESIVIPWSNAYHFEFTGSGYDACSVVQASTTPKSAIVLGVPYAFNRVSGFISGMSIASITNATTNLVYIKGYSDVAGNSFTNFGGIDGFVVENVWFGYWRQMTNNTGWGFGVDQYNTTIKNNMIGLDVECNYNNIVEVRHCVFQNVLPIKWASDHGSIHDNLFGSAGRLGSTAVENDWPNSSALKMGACITFVEPRTDSNGNRVWNVGNNVYVNCGLIYGFNILKQGSFIQDFYFYNDQVESGGSYAAVVDGVRLTAVNPHNSSDIAGGSRNLNVFTNNYMVTNVSDFTTWKNFRDSTNSVRIDRPATNLMTAGYFLKTDGIEKQWSINGSGLTNLNASELRSGALPDARLSVNVPLLNSVNTFVNNNEFSSSVQFDSSVTFINFATFAQSVIVGSSAAANSSNRLQVVSPAGQIITQVTTNGDVYVAGNLNITGNTTLNGPATVGTLTVSGISFGTNLFSGTLFQVGTNYNITTSANLGFTGVANIPTTTYGVGELMVLASGGNVVITNIRAMAFSDGLTNRTLTNGDSAEISIKVTPGVRTNTMYAITHMP